MPISLPYYNIADDEDEISGATKGASSSSAKKGRPTLALVDEMNSNAGEHFLDESGDLKENMIFLLQLPAVLPELADPLEEVTRSEETETSAGAGATITRYPDGLLGKMRIHKSGRVRMEIGGLPFCVDQGSETFFQQDLACVCPLANEIINLGPIHKRMILTPDVDAILVAGGAPETSQPATSASH